MNDNRTGKYPQGKRRGYEPRRFKSLVTKLHREAQQHRSRADDQTSHEAPLVRVTRRLVIATIGLVVVGFLGFGAAVLQWRALSSTDEKTGGVQTALTEQEKLLKRQVEDSELTQRAFVYESAIRGPTIFHFGDGKTINRIDFIWSNSGLTLAKHLSINTACGHTSTEITDGIEAHFPHLERGEKEIFLGPKASDTIGNCTIRDDLIEMIAKHERWFYFWMRADYQDIFSSKWHVTKDCFYLVVQKDGKMDFPGCSDFVCVDEQCRSD